MNNDIHLMNDIIDTADWGVHDGWHITAKMVYDPDGHHWRDSELDDDGLQALEAGDWCYVGVIATARQGDHTGSDSIWGSQYGDFPGGIRCNPLTDQDYMYRADLIDNAVADGKMAASQGVTAVQRWDIYDIADSLADIPGMLTQCGADKLTRRADPRHVPAPRPGIQTVGRGSRRRERRTLPQLRKDTHTMTTQQALTQALILAVTAPTDEQATRAVKLAERIAANCTPAQVTAAQDAALEAVK